MTTKQIYLLLLSCFSCFLGLTQEKEYNGNPDMSFYVAQDLAFSGKYDIAQDTLNHILKKYPKYHDVRNLLASTYSWNGEYDKARGHFNKITSSDRNNKETWVAAIKNEIYAKEYYIALGLANKAINYVEDDEHLNKLRIEVLKLIKESPASQNEVSDNNLEKALDKEDKEYKNNIAITNAYEVFDIAYDPMIYTSVEYKRETKLGSIIPRINYSNRFKINGIQYELDAYPKFSEKIYGYLNYGFSDSPIYPNHRAGAELYVNLPKSIEVSAGTRYMNFNEKQVNIFTGSLGIYKGNYYFSARPYITPSKGRPLGISGTLTGRKYLKDGENYFGIIAGYGFASDLKQLRDGDQVLAETLLFIESQHVRFEYQFSGKKQPHLYRANVGVARQELAYDSGNFYWSLTAGFVYHIKF
ncbi:YaiO family outer membrane beta-barrel protein [Maribacter sp. HTCC2170]|uniref:YaiO family outer membrane beta-barrel protein n=1 Tax=Maribacter sp. (strain HTCC2170 / KCCM 42371) TaxID=313603 RepID=UPI00006AFC7E|nr:YaiO family outer membrane beta-barrel protein [Maribacter sp. HTCC2170]EAR01294.1 hypothetical protein FB2170_11256 [Maribacter sp. HTCC2170]